MDTITSTPVWIKVKTLKDILVAMERLRAMQFSTWSGPSLTDRHGRLLVMIGNRPVYQKFAENKMGLIFTGHEAQTLRDQALTAIAQQHLDRYQVAGQVWTPKPKESE